MIVAVWFGLGVAVGVCGGAGISALGVLIWALLGQDEDVQEREW